MHQRQIIRAAVTAALLEATSAGARVYPTRILPLRRPELPAIAVYTLEESVDAESLQTAPRELTRDLSVVIECCVAAGGGVNVDDAMDDLALEVEAAMHEDPYLGGAAGESILESVVLDVFEEGDRLSGVATLTYGVTYRTFAPEPPADADLDDFERVQATHNLSGDVHPDDVAIDEFIVEETP